MRNNLYARFVNQFRDVGGGLRAPVVRVGAGHGRDSVRGARVGRSGRVAVAKRRRLRLVKGRPGASGLHEYGCDGRATDRIKRALHRTEAGVVGVGVMRHRRGRGD
jgi:hypothetical protein